MNAKKRYTILAVVLVAVLLLAGVGYRVLSDRYNANAAVQQTQSVQQTPSQEVSLRAPDFIVQDREGRQVRFADLAGKPVILNFWATWCPYCKTELPDFDTAFQTYGDDVQFMMIDLCDGQRDTPSAGAAFLKDEGYTFPAYYDTTGSSASAYQVYSIPMTVGIDANGEIKALYTGPVSAETLQDLINTLLS